MTAVGGTAVAEALPHLTGLVDLDLWYGSYDKHLNLGRYDKHFNLMSSLASFHRHLYGSDGPIRPPPLLFSMIGSIDIDVSLTLFSVPRQS
jgi:hypothetical protein